jgi:outer membrane receptor protein involved in Fe transport
VSILAFIDGATAQSTGPGLETITVTARKRAESLQDVPVAVAAISKTELTNNAANSLEKIAELAPQVSIGRVTSGSGALLTIRGISSSAVDSGLDQSVSMSIDGVSLSRGRIVQAAQFDLQQVEVMQGPQALFFGKNSPAGVISITAADPTSSLSGYLHAGYEFEAEEKIIEAALSGPITDTLKGRVAFRYSYMDGWIKNNAPAQANPFQPFAPLPGAANGQDTSPRGHETSGRIALTWQPTDDFEAKLKVTLNSERLNTQAPNNDNFCTNGLTVPNTLGVPESHTDCLENKIRTVSNLPPQLAVNYPYGNGGVPYFRSSLGLASLILTKKFGDISVTSTTGYYDQSYKGAGTSDFGEFAQIFAVEAEHFRQFNEELRVNTDFGGPINGMAGVYYESAHRRFFNSPDLLNIYNPVAQNYTAFMTTSLSDSDSYSVFGQLRWKVVRTVEIAGGLRYSHDDKKSVMENFAGNPAEAALGIFLRPDNTPLSAHYDGNNVSPEATVTWKPTRDQTVYAAYKTGYKSGGISSGALLTTTATSTSVLFGPEKVNGFEVGYKGELFANTFRMDLTFYRYNYNGLQVTALVPPTYSPIIRNAARAYDRRPGVLPMAGHRSPLLQRQYRIQPCAISVVSECAVLVRPNGRDRLHRQRSEPDGPAPQSCTGRHIQARRRLQG